MKITVTSSDARNRLGELLNLVHYQGIEVIITKMGKPVARIVPEATAPKRRHKAN